MRRLAIDPSITLEALNSRARTCARTPVEVFTCVGNWSPDHRQHTPLRVQRNRCGRQATASKQAPNGAHGDENLKKSRQRFAVMIADFCNKIGTTRTSGSPLDMSVHGVVKPPCRLSARNDATTHTGLAERPYGIFWRTGLTAKSASFKSGAGQYYRATLTTPARTERGRCRFVFGHSSQVRPSRVRPVFFLFFPPHCLKWNGTSAATH